MLRLKAEADAADRAQRLRVYAEQLAEYASDKAGAADALLRQAAALAALLQQQAAAGGPPPPPAVVEQMQRLQGELEQAALEARHFAEQQRADAERTKRSSQQVRAGIARDLAPCGRMRHRMSVRTHGLQRRRRLKGLQLQLAHAAVCANRSQAPLPQKELTNQINKLCT